MNIEAEMSFRVIELPLFDFGGGIVVTRDDTLRFLGWASLGSVLSLLLVLLLFVREYWRYAHATKQVNEESFFRFLTARKGKGWIDHEHASRYSGSGCYGDVVAFCVARVCGRYCLASGERTGCIVQVLRRSACFLLLSEFVGKIFSRRFFYNSFGNIQSYLCRTAPCWYLDDARFDSPSR